MKRALLSGLLCAGMAIGVAAGAAEKPVTAQRLKALGFVKYRQWWVLPARRDQLLRDLPALRLRNRLLDSLRVVVDGRFADIVPERGAAAVPLSVGSHKVQLTTRRRQGRTYPIEVQPGYDPQMEVFRTGDAPSVLPALGRAGKRRRRVVEGDDYRIRLRDNKPEEGTLRKVRTRRGNWILGLRGREIGYDKRTWSLTSGYLYTNDGPTLCVSDRLGTYFINGPRIDRTLIQAAARHLDLSRLPGLPRVVQRMGALGDPTFVPVILECMDHQQAWVRSIAAKVLGEIAPPQALDRLRRFGHIEKDENVRRRIDEAISKLEARARAKKESEAFWAADERRRMAILDLLRKNPRDVPLAFLKRLLDQATHPAHREVAAKLLGERRASPAVVELLAKAAADGEPTVRAFAIASLAKLQALEALPVIARRLEDKDARVRAAAGEALGELGVADAIPALIARLEDEDKWARYAAAVALERIFGVRHPVRPDAGPAERAKTLEHWRAWWEGRKGEPPKAGPPGSKAGKVADKPSAAKPRPPAQKGPERSPEEKAIPL